MMRRPGSARNVRLGFALFAVAAAMVVLAFASAPLYRLFCEVTGFGGRPVTASAAPETASTTRITVRFNADVSADLPWSFHPVESEMVVGVGERVLAYYRAENRSATEVAGTATFNVTPLKASPYFAKIECFCFAEQVLQPGQAVELPVSFFVDPAMLQDPGTAELRTITLSYTFFRATPNAAAAARSAGVKAAAAQAGAGG